jgi:hypothetical protein
MLQTMLAERFTLAYQPRDARIQGDRAERLEERQEAPASPGPSQLSKTSEPRQGDPACNGCTRVAIPRPGATRVFLELYATGIRNHISSVVAGRKGCGDLGIDDLADRSSFLIRSHVEFILVFTSALARNDHPLLAKSDLALPGVGGPFLLRGRSHC